MVQRINEGNQNGGMQASADGLIQGALENWVIEYYPIASGLQHLFYVGDVFIRNTTDATVGVFIKRRAPGLEADVTVINQNGDMYNFSLENRINGVAERVLDIINAHVVY